MHIQKTDIPVRVEAPGAVVRQLPDFGTAAGQLGAEYLSLDAGTDIAPLLVGLLDDACDSPHWGYVMSGDLVVSYTDGSIEKNTTGDLFYWPGGHSVRVERDAELILFSPQIEHGVVLDHIRSRLAAMA